MKINEVAKLTGITVRTLHYYDEIGLLAPNQVSSSGYRIYNADSLITLQQILFFRELGFPLNDIKEIMTNPNYNKKEALEKHQELMLQKRARLNGLIALLDKTIKGEKTMSFKEFNMNEIECNRKKYAAEVKERWGETVAYKESEQNINSYGEKELAFLSDECNEMLKAFALNRHLSPNDAIVQKLVENWQSYITNNFYNCTKEILSCLGLMYINDERFTKNIDKNGDGTAAFMAKAMEFYCQ